MLRIFMVVNLLLLSALFTYAQKANGEPGGKWERYITGKGKISIQLPAMPISAERGFVCSELKSNLYATFFDDTFYQIQIFSEGSAPIGCKKIVKFDENTFNERLDVRKDTEPKAVVSPIELSGVNGWRFSTSRVKEWLLFDKNRQRWIEMKIVHPENVVPDEARFAGSLDLTGKEKGQKIGRGSESVIAERLNYEPEVISSSTVDAINDKDDDKTEIDGIVIFSKPYARYTDEARQSNTQGVITLKVEFLGKGTIGKIEVVSGLQNGLIAEATRAAKGIKFLPARKNGRFITVYKTLKYTFTIY